MNASNRDSLLRRVKRIFFGGARDFRDNSIFHKIALIAFFAWIGLGADGLSSSCYGPAEAFITLGQFHYLGIFVALATAFTIMVISTSYSQTIELFPSGGGGYLVASKLHSPVVGMISGSALLIDYVLTISVSVASGADAIFSFLPPEYHQYKLAFAIIGALGLMMLNLRGVKESILILAPIFIIFVLTHVFAITYSIFSHAADVSQAYTKATQNISDAQTQLGFYGMIFLILKAFSMGAGTFTGIEAVSNGLPILREPRVRTGKRTMKYMAFSLAFTAVGLMVAFFLFGVETQAGKTLNAVLFSDISRNWGDWGSIFVYVILLSEAAILFVAAQAGFIDGPRILSNMALDRWMPARFSLLSDRLVTKNGIMWIGIASAVIILLSGGKVELLIILYSINVFITFILTESGMVRHWWQVRHIDKKWLNKIRIHAAAFCLDLFILTSVIIMKLSEGGWITLLITGLVVTTALIIKRHYKKAGRMLKENDNLVDIAESVIPYKTGFHYGERKDPEIGKTAIILVGGYNGLGLHTVFNTMRTFGNVFTKYIFVQVGIIDTGNFKGAGDVDKLTAHVKNEAEKYVKLMNKFGFEAECQTTVGVDILEEIEKIVNELRYYYMDTIVFAGQVQFKRETFMTRLLHNNIVFSLQKKFFDMDIPFVIIPITV